MKAKNLLFPLLLIASYAAAMAVNISDVLYGSLSAANIIFSVIYVAAWLLFVLIFAKNNRWSNILTILFWCATLAVFIVLRSTMNINYFVVFSAFVAPLYGIGITSIQAVRCLVTLTVSAAAFTALAGMNLFGLSKKKAARA